MDTLQDPPVYIKIYQVFFNAADTIGIVNNCCGIARAQNA